MRIKYKLLETDDETQRQNLYRQINLMVAVSVFLEMSHANATNLNSGDVS
jgi:hypothetical protein